MLQGLCFEQSLAEGGECFLNIWFECKAQTVQKRKGLYQNNYRVIQISWHIDLEVHLYKCIYKEI